MRIDGWLRSVRSPGVLAVEKAVRFMGRLPCLTLVGRAPVQRPLCGAYAVPALENGSGMVTFTSQLGLLKAQPPHRDGHSLA